MAGRIRLKLRNESEIRVVMVSSSTDWVELNDRLCDDYGFRVSLKYEDADGDMITLSSANDLKELLSCGQDSLNVIVSEALLPTLNRSRSNSTVHSSSSSKSRRRASSDIIQNEMDRDKDPELTDRSSRLKSSTMAPEGSSTGGNGELRGDGISSTRSNKVSTDEGPSLSSAVPVSHLGPDQQQQQHHKTGAATLTTNNSLASSTSSFLSPQPSSRLTNKNIKSDRLPSIELSINMEPDTGFSTISNNPRQVRWKKGEILGQGAFGVVYLGLNIDTGELMAVKQIAVEEVSSKEVSVLQNEIHTLKSLLHPNIVRYIGTEITPSALSIFLEYIPGKCHP